MKDFFKKIGHDINTFISIFDVISDLIFLMEVDGDSFRYLYVNQSAINVLKIEGEIIGKLIEEVVPSELAKILIPNYKQVINEHKPSNFIETLSTDDGEFIGEASLNPILMSDGESKFVLAIVRDVTELKKAEMELKKNEEKSRLIAETLANMAFYDYLTGLPNRRSFDDKLITAIHEADQHKLKVAVMMIDGRKFKQINDTYGHDAGDAVIKEMANRLQACVRQTDTVARFGGDEMGIILPELISVEIAEIIAKRILRLFEVPMIFENKEIEMGADIGIALYPDHSTDKKQLVKYADIALYHAKESKQSDYSIFKSNGQNN